MSRVVIIDTGIDLANESLLKKCKNVSGICVTKNNNNSSYNVVTFEENPNCIYDDVGHGSAIANIILSHNPNVELFIVKIFTKDSLLSNEDMLVFTLEYVFSNIDFDIVNLSLGVLSVNAKSRLEEVCIKYRESNKIIIAAFDNNGSISYPAAYKSVIGVTSEKFCNQANEYYVVDNDIVNICAKGRKQRVLWKDGTYISGSGSSYACAHFTGIFSNVMNGSTWDELWNDIKKECSGFIPVTNSNRNTSILNPVYSYSRVVAFPFNKEIHSLVRFSHMLPFDLIDVYDIKYSARVGASTDSILKYKCKNNYIIKSIEDIDWASFDTIILGHIDDLFYFSNIEESKEKLIEEILAHGKNIYAFDDISEYISEYAKGKKPNVYIPLITKKDIFQIPFGKLYRQDKPVLGIFGTSSRQGKFTLQLLLRYELQKRGYSICQLGTEPSALLYGMDIVFPIGYNSTVKINRSDTISYLNKMLYDHSRDSDIIIVGGQSGLVLREEGNLADYDFTQMELIYSSLPDAVIICINSFDDIDVILRAKKFVEATSGCDVIAMVMYPFFYSEKDYNRQRLLTMTYEMFTNSFKKKFEQLNTPIYFPNSEEDIGELCDKIIEYFSE